ncbi:MULTISPECIES: DUF2514 family protein [Kosakonia]|uniref:DUF2514 family protein n=1 Tax=Kosakonia TaxID=1330547 RepID=UPI0005EE56E6|nr:MULTISPECIES: DUF2514 family protein [Kosakonia]RCW95878.1 uncharacterized protein DUF2514 [Kosakonia sp. AG348]
MVSFIGQYWLKVITVLISIALFWAGDHHGAMQANNAWRIKWAQRDRDDANALAQRQAQERAEEHRRQRAADAERKQADEERASAQADADAAKRAGDKLHKSVAELRNSLARSETGKLSALAAERATREKAGILLADLLRESDAAAGEYAKEADRAYTAGRSCERTYDAVTGVKTVKK